MNGTQFFAEHPAKTLQIIGVACGLGARDQRCETGPDALRAARLTARLHSRGLRVAWCDTVRPEAAETDALKAVADTCRRLARRVADIVQRGDLPVVLGGDHSCAIGTWKGIARALAPEGAPGLIWVDAHMDAHTPQTTPSGALHGMPLACLLGYGDPRLTAIADGVRLDPRHVCLVGVRSFEAGEAQLLRRLGVRIYFMHEIARRGLDAVLREALERASRGTAGFGLSLDLDALDPQEAPGVGTPVPGGLSVGDLSAALTRLARHPRLAGVEIVEYNPARDCGSATAASVAELLTAIATGQCPLQTSIQRVAA